MMTIIAHLTDPLKRELLLRQASDMFSSSPRNTQDEGAYEDTTNYTEAGRTEEKDQPLRNLSQLEKKLFSAILYHKSTVQEEDATLYDYF